MKEEIELDTKVTMAISFNRLLSVARKHGISSHDFWNMTPNEFGEIIFEKEKEREGGKKSLDQ